MSSTRRRLVPALVLAILVPSAGWACLWDSDTLWMEQQRFPDAIDLIAGKFERHTPEFYRWRIEDRLTRLKADPKNVSLLDDLAVAYDKTNQHDLAIETALKTERLQPGRYETAANLGTFYIHAGRPAEGLPHIGRALKINPDAHFGRERYQKFLVEYVTSRRKGGPLVLPLARPTGPPDPRTGDGFAAWLHTDRGVDLNSKEVAAAVKGVLGMMRFGQHDSPVLLEALGTLLLLDGGIAEGESRFLATRAFLKASFEVSDESVRSEYRRLADRALHQKRPAPESGDLVTLSTIEYDLRREIDEAKSWYENWSGRERSWIREGKNPEVEAEREKKAVVEVQAMDPVPEPMDFNKRLSLLLLVAGSWFIFALFAVPLLIGSWLTRRRAMRAPSSDQIP